MGTIGNSGTISGPTFDNAGGYPNYQQTLLAISASIKSKGYTLGPGSGEATSPTGTVYKISVGPNGGVTYTSTGTKAPATSSGSSSSGGTAPKPASTSTSTSAPAGPTGGQYYGFNSPEEAMAYANSIKGATPQQLDALTGIAGTTSTGEASNLDFYQLEQRAREAAAAQGLDYATLSQREQESLRDQALGYAQLNSSQGVDYASINQRATSDAAQTGLGYAQLNAQTGVDYATLNQRAQSDAAAMGFNYAQLNEQQRQALMQNSLAYAQLNQQSQNQAGNLGLGYAELNQRAAADAQAMGFNYAQLNEQQRQALAQTSVAYAQIQQQQQQFAGNLGFDYAQLNSQNQQASGNLGLGYAQLNSQNQQFGQNLGFDYAQLNEQARQDANRLGFDYANLNEAQRQSLQQNSLAYAQLNQQNQNQYGDRQLGYAQLQQREGESVRNTQFDYAQLNAQLASQADAAGINWASLNQREQESIRNLAATYYNITSDANAARQQALSTLIQAKQSGAIDLAQMADQRAAQAAQFAANPRDWTSFLNYQTATGGQTPLGTQGQAWGDYQTGLDNTFQSIFGDQQDLQRARQFVDQPLPQEYLTPQQSPQTPQGQTFTQPPTQAPTQVQVPQLTPGNFAPPAPPAQIQAPQAAPVAQQQGPPAGAPPPQAAPQYAPPPPIQVQQYAPPPPPPMMQAPQIPQIQIPQVQAAQPYAPPPMPVQQYQPPPPPAPIQPPPLPPMQQYQPPPPPAPIQAPAPYIPPPPPAPIQAPAPVKPPTALTQPSAAAPPPSTMANPASVTGVPDMNKDGRIDSADQALFAMQNKAAPIGATVGGTTGVAPPVNASGVPQKVGSTLPGTVSSGYTPAISAGNLVLRTGSNGIVYADTNVDPNQQGSVFYDAATGGWRPATQADLDKYRQQQYDMIQSGMGTDYASVETPGQLAAVEAGRAGITNALLDNGGTLGAPGSFGPGLDALAPQNMQQLAAYMGSPAGKAEVANQTAAQYAASDAELASKGMKFVEINNVGQAVPISNPAPYVDRRKYVANYTGPISTTPPGSPSPAPSAPAPAPAQVTIPKPTTMPAPTAPPLSAAQMTALRSIYGGREPTVTEQRQYWDMIMAGGPPPTVTPGATYNLQPTPTPAPAPIAPTTAGPSSPGVTGVPDVNGDGQINSVDQAMYAARMKAQAAPPAPAPAPVAPAPVTIPKPVAPTPAPAPTPASTPTAPKVGQTKVENGTTYMWTGGSWMKTGSSIGIGGYAKGGTVNVNPRRFAEGGSLSALPKSPLFELPDPLRATRPSPMPTGFKPMEPFTPPKPGEPGYVTPLGGEGFAEFQRQYNPQLIERGVEPTIGNGPGVQMPAAPQSVYGDLTDLNGDGIINSGDQGLRARQQRGLPPYTPRPYPQHNPPVGFQPVIADPMPKPGEPGPPTPMPPYRNEPTTPQGFAGGGKVNFDELYNSRSQSGFSPPSSEGGTNMNIHERAIIMGESGQIYGTLGERRPDGTPRAEQLIIKPLPSEVKKDKAMEDQNKQSIESTKSTMKQFAEGGTVTAGGDFLNSLRARLRQLAPGATFGPNPDPFYGISDMNNDQIVNSGDQGLLARNPGMMPNINSLAPAWGRLQLDPDLLDLTHAGYSKLGIPDRSFDATIRRFQPTPFGSTSTRYAARR